VIAGLPLPDRAVGGPARPTPAVVEVRPGDSLWAIARRDLGSEADDAAVTARWHEIYELNRTVVGADPDLIQPAQRLRLPAG
jgi:nucleoid-associated protein YgaU